MLYNKMTTEMIIRKMEQDKRRKVRGARRTTRGFAETKPQTPAKYKPPYWNTRAEDSRSGIKGGLSASAEHGSIPAHFITDKFKTTDLHEDPEELDTYMRNMLTYYGRSTAGP